MSLTVAVITSTIGRDTIAQAHESVRNQTYPATHYIFAHGKNCWETVEHNMGDYMENDNVQMVYLPRANGGNGYGMAPVFALAGYAVTEDICVFLDDDNWYEPDHIETLVKTIEDNNTGWAYSLRKIVDNEGNWICDDNCESLGVYPNSHNQHVVDNSCYAVKTEVARRFGYAWYVPIISDRNFFQVLVEAKIPVGSTGKHSVNYRLSKDGTGGMNKEKFEGNNKFMQETYKGNLPWLTPSLFKFEGATNG